MAGVGSEHGYSGKPLAQKLGFKDGMAVLAIGAPEHYSDLLGETPGVTFRVRAKSADAVHLFCPDRAALDRKIESALAKVADGGMLWVSWPKKSSPMFKDLTEGDLRSVILPTGFVDVKVCAVDQDWSGLKFLRRKS